MTSRNYEMIICVTYNLNSKWEQFLHHGGGKICVTSLIISRLATRKTM